jgi:hypothetical protein
VPLVLGAFSVLLGPGPDRTLPVGSLAITLGPARLLELVLARLAPEPAGPRPGNHATPPAAQLGRIGLSLADLVGIRIPVASLDPELAREELRRTRFRPE